MISKYSDEDIDEEDDTDNVDDDDNPTLLQDLECPDRVLIGGEETDEGREAIQELVEVSRSKNSSPF